MRWWLFVRLAKWMGLRVGVKGMNSTNSHVTLVVLTRDDRDTLAAVRLLVKAYGGDETGRGSDTRIHREWTH